MGADASGKPVERIPDATILFAGDSGDGMQLTGAQFTLATAFAQNDLATLPDFPAEIRAPAGTTYGVSGFQLHFGTTTIRTPGDDVDAPSTPTSGSRWKRDRTLRTLSAIRSPG